MKPFRGTRAFFALLSCFAFAACTAFQDSEKIADEVMQPFVSVDQGSLESLDDAYQNARIRLTEVRNEELRAQLSGIVDQKYQRLLAIKREAEQKAAAEAAARAAEAEARAQAARVRQAVIDLEGGMRTSPVGGQVLQLRNGASFQVDFDLKCYTQDNSTFKTFFVSVPARGQREIGWLEGWTDNFKPGEHCEAYYQRELLWDRGVPEL